MEAKLAADLKTNIAKVIVGKDEVVELLAHGYFGQWACAAGGCAGHRENVDGEIAGPLAGTLGLRGFSLPPTCFLRM